LASLNDDRLTATRRENRRGVWKRKNGGESEGLEGVWSDLAALKPRLRRSRLSEERQRAVSASLGKSARSAKACIMASR
jgi:hypothetical protein